MGFECYDTISCLICMKELLIPGIICDESGGASSKNHMSLMMSFQLLCFACIINLLVFRFCYVRLHDDIFILIPILFMVALCNRADHYIFAL